MDDVDLSLFWDIPELGKQGHHYIIGINLSLQPPLHLHNLTASFNTTRALFEQTAREKAALTTSLLKMRHKDISPLRIMINAKKQYEQSFVTR